MTRKIKTQPALQNLVNFPYATTVGKPGKDFMRKEDLVDGEYYYGRCRNAVCARWYAEDEEFEYVRTKFGARFVESIKHPEDHFGMDVFVPLYRCYPQSEDLVPDDEPEKS